MDLVPCTFQQESIKSGSVFEHMVPELMCARERLSALGAPRWQDDFWGRVGEVHALQGAHVYKSHLQPGCFGEIDNVYRLAHATTVPRSYLQSGPRSVQAEHFSAAMHLLPSLPGSLR